MGYRFPVCEIVFSLPLHFISKMGEGRLAGRQARRKEELEITSNTNLRKIVSIKKPRMVLWALL